MGVNRFFLFWGVCFCLGPEKVVENVRELNFFIFLGLCCFGS